VSLESELLAKLATLEDVAGRPGRFLIAFSGGLDSTVLLHALATTRERHGVPLVAVHVDHGLQPESGDWSAWCRSFAARPGIDFVALEVEVDRHSGLGLEAAARAARYGALMELLGEGDWLLSAHHRDDQAETLLLNLTRGSGPAGLAGIGESRPLGAGWLMRPLLAVSRETLEEYARRHSLDWITDPTNEDPQFDRNYLRHEVLPLLDARWPGVAERLGRSAALAGEAAALLEELAALDCRGLGERPDRLDLKPFRELSPARQRNVLRYVLVRLGLPLPGAAQLEQIVTELVAAREDAQPLVAWPGAEARRYRDRLYLMPGAAASSAVETVSTASADCIPLPGNLGVLRLRGGAESGLSDIVMERGLELRFRSGGERFRPAGQRHTRTLKNLLQEEGIVPWMRERVPLLYSGGELVAVADLWVAADAASRPGTTVEWQRRPALH
jgi:tRNA(Ile)-lysidine synthase